MFAGFEPAPSFRGPLLIPGTFGNPTPCSTGICTFDPGFGSTASCESSITYIDGNKGILLYRG